MNGKFSLQIPLFWVLISSITAYTYKYVLFNSCNFTYLWYTVFNKIWGGIYLASKNEIDIIFRKSLNTIQEIFVKQYYKRKDIVDTVSLLKVLDIGLYRNNICNTYLTDKETLLVSNLYKIKIPNDLEELFKKDHNLYSIEKVDCIEYLPFFDKEEFCYDVASESFTIKGKASDQIALEEGLPDLDKSASIIGVILLHKDNEYFILVFTDLSKTLEELPTLRCKAQR